MQKRETKTYVLIIGRDQLFTTLDHIFPALVKHFYQATLMVADFYQKKLGPQISLEVAESILGPLPNFAKARELLEKCARFNLSVV